MLSNIDPNQTANVVEEFVDPTTGNTIRKYDNGNYAVFREGNIAYQYNSKPNKALPCGGSQT